MLNTGKGCPYFGTGVCDAFINAALKSYHFSRTSRLIKKTGFVDDTFLCIPRPNILAVLIGNFQLLSKLSKQGCEATPLLQAPAPRLPMLAEEAPAIATSKKNVNNY